MKKEFRMKIIFTLSALLLAFLVMTVPAKLALARTFSDQVVTTVKSDSSVQAYEADAQVLRQIHDTAKARCATGKVPRKDCTQLDILYQETRTAFIAQGDRLKEFRKKPDPKNKQRWLNASKEFGMLFGQLKSLAQKNGVEVRK
jgi:hypothetical protein